MNLKLEIRRNSDGVIATDTWIDFDYNAYWWKEGNACCDCNRESFFLSARNEDDTDDTECGKGKYSVRLSDADTMAALYDELTPSGQS